MESLQPKTAQTVYQLGAIASAGLSLALIWGGVDAGAANNLQMILAGIIALVPGASSAIGAKRVNTQRKDGTFESLSPAEHVAKGLSEAKSLEEQFKEQQRQIKSTISATVDGVPVFGDLAKAALNFG